uniref:J domain-containing protein n=1 Tax=Ascaris lumbricoides TaxID=6252 RepID=A0A0M3HLU0_ASCLU
MFFIISVKKAFFKQSLRCHPDRCVEESAKKEATEKFQIISRAYAILSDEEKRKVYDETGMMDDAELCGDDVNWEERWRAMFKKVTKEDIQSFVEQYKGDLHLIRAAVQVLTIVKESLEGVAMYAILHYIVKSVRGDRDIATQRSGKSSE